MLNRLFWQSFLVMELATASQIVSRIIGKSVRYATSKASSLNTDDYRNFTIVEVEKIAQAAKTGIWYFTAKVIDHDDNDSEKVRSLHFEGIV